MPERMEGSFWGLRLAMDQEVPEPSCEVVRVVSRGCPTYIIKEFVVAAAAVRLDEIQNANLE